MSLYLGENLISGNKPINLGVRNIGEIVSSSLPLTDAGLHLLDGSLILGGGIYQGFVDYIADLYGDGTNIPSYFCTESEWQTAVTTYGVCGKFVYDSTNNTVRLPKVTGIIEGTTDVSALGDLVEAGLPNITGTWGPSGYRFATSHHDNITGAFTYSTSSGDRAPYNASGNAVIMELDASRSSAIYGNSTTVQPQTIKCFVYIVIANSTKTQIQSDIDEIATDLNGKADTDLSNINASQSAKNEIISWGMPDYNAGIDIGTANKYEALVDGYYVGKAVVAGGTNSTSRIIVNLYNGSNTLVVSIGTSGYDNISGNDKVSSTTLPVPKGYKITVGGVIGTLTTSSFYPLKGAN